jgi:hypothetical protein
VSDRLSIVGGATPLPDGWLPHAYLGGVWSRLVPGGEILAGTAEPCLSSTGGYRTNFGPYPWPVYPTLAEACRAAERAYCGAYVGRTTPMSRSE